MEKGGVPGYRFHPTDEEVVAYYLTSKAIDASFSCPTMDELDLYEFDPWELPRMAKNWKRGETEWWFFSRRDRRYPKGRGTGSKRTNSNGFWKASGKDKGIMSGRPGVLIGRRKTLVFYLGKPSKGGEKTPWIMHEYCLDGHLPSRLPDSAKDEWAVCRVFSKDGDDLTGGADIDPNKADVHSLDSSLQMPLHAEEPIDMEHSNIGGNFRELEKSADHSEKSADATVSFFGLLDDADACLVSELLIATDPLFAASVGFGNSDHADLEPICPVDFHTNTDAHMFADSLLATEPFFIGDNDLVHPDQLPPVPLMPATSLNTVDVHGEQRME